MTTTSVILCEDPAGIAARALDLLLDGMRTGIARRGEAHLALTGGSSAAALLTRLREDDRARRVDWSRVHVWQGDERVVPLEHPDRNWAAALRDWLHAPDGPAIPEAQLHPIPVDGATADEAAERYAQQMARRLPHRGDRPAFDVLLLGVGGDGHILSTFPGGDAVTEQERSAVGVPAPSHIGPHLPRVTLVPALLPAAGMVLVMVPGGGKAAVVAQVLTTPADPLRLPARLAVRPNAIWLLEPGSAADLQA